MRLRQELDRVVRFRCTFAFVLSWLATASASTMETEWMEELRRKFLDKFFNNIFIREEIERGESWKLIFNWKITERVDYGDDGVEGKWNVLIFLSNFFVLKWHWVMQQLFFLPPFFPCSHSLDRAVVDVQLFSVSFARVNVSEGMGRKEPDGRNKEQVSTWLLLLTPLSAPLLTLCTLRVVLSL